MPPQNITTKPRNSRGRNSALDTNTKKCAIYTQDLLIAPREVASVPSISQKGNEGWVLPKTAPSVPFSILKSNGGERDVYY